MLHDLLMYLHKNFLYLCKPKRRFSCIVCWAEWIAHPQMLIANIVTQFKQLATAVYSCPLGQEITSEKL